MLPASRHTGLSILVQRFEEAFFDESPQNKPARYILTEFLRSPTETHETPKFKSTMELPEHGSLKHQGLKGHVF